MRAFRRTLHQFQQRRSFSSAYSFAPERAVPVEQYSRSLSLLHWAIGGSIVTCVATVKMAQWTKNKEWKGRLMNVHKSLAVVVTVLLPLRFGARYLSNIPKPLPGSKIEQLAGSLSHVALYGFMTLMPLSGIAMGYFSGFGVPFFFTKVPGSASPTPNKELAGSIYKVHSIAGQVLTYFLPIHVGASFAHYFLKGHTQIFTRISPIR